MKPTLKTYKKSTSSEAKIKNIYKPPITTIKILMKTAKTCGRTLMIKSLILAITKTYLRNSIYPMPQIKSNTKEN
jgi:hypothetical protein